jgi:hypothetical protein
MYMGTNVSGDLPASMFRDKRLTFESENIVQSGLYTDDLYAKFDVVRAEIIVLYSEDGGSKLR